MDITPSHLNYYFLCKRKCWLHGQGIRMEDESENVQEGILISESSYSQRAEKYKELDLGIGKIDHYDPENKIVHEVKKSDRFEEAHEWQVKYYIWLLERIGIFDAQGLLEYPRSKKTKEVFFTEEDRARLMGLLEEVQNLIEQDSCPPATKGKLCEHCGFHDLCWSGEEVEE